MPPRPAVPALALALALAAPALAGHQTGFTGNPVEHDDQGRSDEPDLARTTVLGPPLENRVLDLDRDGVAAPDRALPPPAGRAAVLAPGCHGPQGRLPSGACGAETTGVYGLDLPAGAPCVACAREAPPGAYTPTRATVVRFLDARADLTTNPPFLGLDRVDVNHKLRDAAHAAGLAPPEPALAGSVLWWAWLGEWQDKNANGVIDHLVDGQGAISPANEFVWRGGCLRLGGGFSRGPHCEPEGRPALAGFAFPGSHHGGLRVLGDAQPCPSSWLCRSHLGDLPGAEPLCLAAGATLRCAGPGDPLLGPQDGVAPDDLFLDRTGEPIIDWRGWAYGVGWPAWYYDQSLAVGHVFVAAYDAPPAPGSPNRLELARARFLDVDVHRALSPEVEALVQGQVKPAARGVWLGLAGDLAPVLGN